MKSKTANHPPIAPITRRAPLAPPPRCAAIAVELKPSAPQTPLHSPRSAASPIPTFRRFPQKPPKLRTAPTHARHASCNRKKSRVSPYVTFDHRAISAANARRFFIRFAQAGSLCYRARIGGGVECGTGISSESRVEGRDEYENACRLGRRSRPSEATLILSNRLKVGLLEGPWRDGPPIMIAGMAGHSPVYLKCHNML